MPNITKTTAASFIPTIWSKDIIIATESNLVLAPATFRQDKYVKNGGDTVKLPTLANLTASDKAAGTAITYSANTESVVTLSMNVHKYAAVLIEDIVKVQADADMRGLYTEKMGYAVAKAADTSIAVEMIGGFTNIVNPSAVQATRLSLGNFSSADRFLNGADAPDNDRFLVLDHFGIEQVKLIPEFTRYDALGKSYIENGVVGEIFGFKVLRSTVVGNAVGNGTNGVAANVGVGFAFQRNSVAFAMQDSNPVAEYSVDQLGWKLANQAIYGVKTARADHGVQIKYGTNY